MSDTPPVEAILADVEAGRSDDGPTFDAPWQARAFGLAVAAIRDGDRFEWAEFQSRLAHEVESGVDAHEGGSVEGTYYAQWLAAFETLLVEDGVLDDESIDERAMSFARGDRTADEFVEGPRDH
jgi:nitrile hydratase accessory protein